ncbi:MAG TPA: glycosyltransferase [Cyclobacteriaceae bacterium]
MANKKVLIITYYWPPAGGIPVQRWLKFAKYLRENQWEPVIYTVSNGDYLTDESLLTDVPKDIEVIRQPIWEPYTLYRFLSNSKKAKKNARIEMTKGHKVSLLQKISVWLRGNLFIPDARRFWIGPSFRFLRKYLRDNKADVIVSTGPPHSTHIIGMKLHKDLGIPWLADFRDPWTSMDYYHDLNLTDWADRKHQSLEREVIQTASKVTVIGNSMKEEFEGKGSKQVVVLPNGFDEEDFKLSAPVPLDKKFSIVHTGSFFPRRNPLALWKALSKLKEESHPVMKDIEIKLVGNVHETVINSINTFGLNSYLNLVAQKPFKEVLVDIHAAQILLLPIDNFEGAKWVITGKAYEYLAVKRPILCIGPPDGDAAFTINSTQSGKAFGFTDVDGIKAQLIKWHHEFKEGNLKVNSREIESYSRKGLTRELATILNTISA